MPVLILLEASSLLLLAILVVLATALLARPAVPLTDVFCRITAAALRGAFASTLLMPASALLLLKAFCCTEGDAAVLVTFFVTVGVADLAILFGAGAFGLDIGVAIREVFGETVLVTFLGAGRGAGVAFLGAGAFGLDIGVAIREVFGAAALATFLGAGRGAGAAFLGAGAAFLGAGAAFLGAGAAFLEAGR